MSRIAVVYNPVQKISSAITNKIYSAEKFLENQTHHKTFTIRNKLLDGHALISIVLKEDNKKQYFNDKKKEIHTFIDGSPLIGEKYIYAEDLAREYLDKGPEKMAQKIDGSWCALIVDEKKKSLLLFRNRFGHIPFYYSKKSNYFFAGSSAGSLIKSGLIPANYNENIIARYASSNYRATYGLKESFFKDISLVEPAAYLIFKSDGSIQQKKYWMPDLNSKYLNCSNKEIEEKFLDCLLKIIKKYYKVNIGKEFGVTLSGGIDSGAIIGLLHKVSQKKIKALSLTYNEDTSFDETDLLKHSVRDHASEWNDIKVNENQLLKDLPNLYSRFDIPLCTVTAYCHEILYKYADKFGIPNLFTGAGGDSLQAGNYPSLLYNLADLKISDEEKYKHELNCWIKNHGTKIFPKKKETAELFFENHIDFENKGRLKSGSILLVRDILDKNFEKKAGSLGQPVVQFSGDYLRSYMMQELWYDNVAAAVEGEDVMCWSWGVDVVSPFFDQKIIDLALNLPSHYKIKDGINKTLARKVLRGIVPDKILDTVEKKGFNAPFDLWVRGSLKQFVMDHLTSKKFQSRGIYNQNVFQKCLNDHMEGSANHMMLIWQALNLELWMKNWIDTNKK